MAISITQLVQEMQKLIENENNTLNGGFLAINSTSTISSSAKPIFYDNVLCTNRICNGSSNALTCLNENSCANSTNEYNCKSIGPIDYGSSSK